MTDRYKGFLVTVQGELRSDEADNIINALKMVKGVENVFPYVKEAEDYMMEGKAKRDAYNDILQVIYKKHKETFGI